MTYSNGAYSPNPLANPFNTRRYGNYSLNPFFNEKAAQQLLGVNVGNGNPKNLQVPNQDVPMYGTEEWEAKYNKQASLTVPNQDVPEGDICGRQGFIPGTNLFRCHDGTVVDFKTRKIVAEPGQNPGYWGNPNERLQQGTDSSWSDVNEPTIEQMMSNLERYRGTAVSQKDCLDSQLDPKSAAYWLKAREEAEKLQAEMTDSQKKMLDDFEKHFPRSRLIDEAMKAESGKILEK